MPRARGSRSRRPKETATTSPDRAGRGLRDGSGLTTWSLEQIAEVAGPEHAPVVVLLHGTRRTRAMWRHQVDGLSDEFRTVAVDLPGHGILADVPFGMTRATGLVAAVIEATGGRATVVGQSLGGYVAMDVAARRPELVTGLVLVNATAEPRTILRHAPGTVGSYLLGAGRERLTRSRLPIRRRRHGAPSNTLPATRGWLFKGGGRATAWALRQSFAPRLAAYPGPTLILNGADDPIFRLDEDSFLAVAADGRRDLIAGTGHLVNEDRPADFNTTIRRFGREIQERPGGSGSRPGVDRPRGARS